MTDLFSQKNLYAMRSIGQHLASRAREKGENTSQSLAFVGIITMAIGATMLIKVMEQSRGR